MFNFFLKSYRSGLLTFAGVEIETFGDPTLHCGKEGFRLYDDGFYKKGKRMVTRHPNILRGVVIGKKAWGLWIDQWSDGIVDWTFTLEEILKEFEDRNIVIPESLLKDFHNRILKKNVKRDDLEIERLRSLTY